MVARDYAGELMQATTKCRYGQTTPEMAEALGIKEALSWLKSRAA